MWEKVSYKTGGAAVHGVNWMEANPTATEDGRFGEPGSKRSLPMAVCFALLLESQLRAPISQQFLCQEDTVKLLNEVSSQSSSGWSPHKRCFTRAAAGAAGWSGGVLYYSPTGANLPQPWQQHGTASKLTSEENPEKLYWKCLTVMLMLLSQTLKS